MNKDWTDLIREKLLNYEEPVPGDLWDRVQASLIARERARRRTRILVWSVAAAAAIAVGVFTGVNLVDKGPAVNDLIVADSQEHRTASPEIPSSSADIEEGPVSSGSPVTIVRGKGTELIAMASDQVEPVTEPVPEPVTEPVVEPVGEPAVNPVEKPSEKPVEIVEESPVQKPESSFKTDHDGEDWSGYSDASVDRLGGRIRNLVAGLSVSSATADSRNVNTVESSRFFLGAAPSSLNSDEYTYFLPSRNSATTYAAVNTKAVSEPVTKSENHRRPVRAALSLSYPLNDTFWLESGLTYSLLHSTFTISSGMTVSEDSQVLAYLGVPLNLRANLLSKDLFAFYLVGGGMGEKCLRGDVNSATTVSGTPRVEPTSRKLDLKPLQWSVNTSAGLQFNVKDSFGIYAEPGLSYRFANNAAVRSIYTEHPLDFVMTFGARFSFR